MSTNTQKLRVLRERTDHDLVLLVSRELDRGLALVEAAATRHSPVFGQAVKAHETAVMLLPRVFSVSQDDRRRIETKVAKLQSRLDAVPLYANVRPMAVAS
jgi:hypothetical protein